MKEPLGKGYCSMMIKALHDMIFKSHILLLFLQFSLLRNATPLLMRFWLFFKIALVLQETGPTESWFKKTISYNRLPVIAAIWVVFISTPFQQFKGIWTSCLLSWGIWDSSLLFVLQTEPHFFFFNSFYFQNCLDVCSPFIRWNFAFSLWVCALSPNRAVFYFQKITNI